MLTLRSKTYFSDPEFPFWIKRHAQVQYPPHRHEFFEFFFVLSGSLGHTLGKKNSIILPGDLVFLSPAHWHSFSSDEKAKKTEIVTCLFLQKLFDDFIPMLRKQPEIIEMLVLAPFFNQGMNVLRLTGLTDYRTRMVLEEMVDEYEHQPLGYQFAIRAKLMDLLVTLVRSYSESRQAKPHLTERISFAKQVILECLDFIQNNYTQPISLEKIAVVKAGFSKEYFCTLFHNITGRTFVDYVTALRIKKAKDLLLIPNLPITEVCYNSGFNDLSYFCRLFRRLEGCSPTAYRKEILNRRQLES